MKKWAFIVQATNWNKVRSIVEKEAKKVVRELGKPEDGNILYKVTATFYQKRERWIQPERPRQDIGADLDNLLKRVFDGLGPIIGYRKDYTGRRKHAGVRDSSIIEVYAKKVNSGSKREFLAIEVETWVP